MKAINKIRSNRRGFTLIEALVVTALILAVSGATTWVLIGITTASVDASQRLRQYTTIELLGGLLDSRLSSANRVGWETGDELLESSLADDQLVFKRGQQCSRLMYFQDRGEIWLVRAPACPTLIGPESKRPNNLEERDQDPIIAATLDAQERDPGIGYFRLAEGIRPIGDEPVLAYFNVFKDSIDSPAEAITEVQLKVRTLGDPGRPEADQLVGNRDFVRSIYLNQVCPPD